MWFNLPLHVYNLVDTSSCYYLCIEIPIRGSRVRTLQWKYENWDMWIMDFACLPSCSFAHACEGSSLQAGTPELAYATVARPCRIGCRSGLPWGVYTTTGPLGAAQAGLPWVGPCEWKESTKWKKKKTVMNVYYLKCTVVTFMFVLILMSMFMVTEVVISLLCKWFITVESYYMLITCLLLISIMLINHAIIVFAFI